jgi:hypothetical protein
VETPVLALVLRRLQAPTVLAVLASSDSVAAPAAALVLVVL